MDMGKYNGRLQALEKLRKETMAELCDLEDDVGKAESIMDSTERPEISTYGSHRKSPRKDNRHLKDDHQLVVIASTADQDFRKFSDSQNQLIQKHFRTDL
jgi:hypothetical protein